MSNDPIDLRALDLGADASADAFVAAVISEIQRRETRLGIGDVLGAVWALAKPTLTATAMIVGVSLVREARVAAAPARPSTVAEALGVPLEFRALAPLQGVRIGSSR